MDIISSNLNAGEKDSWATPQWLFDALNLEFNFKADMAASETNAKCEVFCDVEHSSLDWDWSKSLNAYEFAWCNPPYSRGMIKQFMEKAVYEMITNQIGTVLLVPATPDAGWWPCDATEIRLITDGRISFVNPVTGKSINGNTKGSALIIFNPFTFHFQENVIHSVPRFILQEMGKAAQQSQQLKKAV